MNLIVPKIEGLVKEAFNSFSSDYWNELNLVKSELSQIKTSQQFLSDKFEEMKTKIIEVSDSNSDCKKTTSKLSEDISKFVETKNNEFFKIDQLEQYGRRLNLELEEVPQYSNENVTDIVVQLTKKLNIDVKIDDISITHRLPPKTVKNKYNNYCAIHEQTSKKRDLCKKKKGKACNRFPIKGMKKLY